MTRSNLAVCFSPVIFRFNLEKKSKLKQTLYITNSASIGASNSKNNLKRNSEEKALNISQQNSIEKTENENENENEKTTNSIIKININETTI